MSDENRLYNFDEAAGFLGISTSTLRKKVAAGQAPHRRVFRHVRFSEADLRAMQQVRPAVTGGVAVRRRSAG